jgi:hypothetical protein
MRENCDSFSFRPGKYEAGNDKTAIELLAGDPLVLAYLMGAAEEKEICEHLWKSEEAWIKKVSKYRFYEEPLVRNSN